MASPRIVKAVDVLKEGGVDLPSGVPCVAPNEFSLHRLEECFYFSVVKVIALATLRDFEAMSTDLLFCIRANNIGGHERHGIKT